MVAVIHFTKGFHHVLNYNENKVKEQVAVCLEAKNYPKKADDLTFTQKLKRLENLAELNEKTKTNCIHISLNFDPSEQFSADKLKEIAAMYMDKIGFGEQPYLLYRHDDAGHPHTHLITTNIKADGTRIRTHNLGKNESEKARKEIELQFGLLRPEDSEQRKLYRLQAVNAQKVAYGKTATKRAVTTVLDRVLNTYKFSSLPELNAVLRQYNVLADAGGPNSKVFLNNGLVYRVLDERGNKTGVPIKASDFYNKPTLKVLQEKFITNEPLKQPHVSRVKTAIDKLFLSKEQPTLKAMVFLLKRKGIDTIIRQNESGFVYGITYVDHRTKCVFNGSDLGKTYSAKGIQERCRPEADLAFHFDRQGKNDLSPFGGIADALLQQEFTGDMTPFELRKKKKKRKRLSNNQ